MPNECLRIGAHFVLDLEYFLGKLVPILITHDLLAVLYLRLLFGREFLLLSFLLVEDLSGEHSDDAEARRCMRASNYTNLRKLCSEQILPVRPVLESVINDPLHYNVSRMLLEPSVLNSLKNTAAPASVPFNTLFVR